MKRALANRVLTDRFRSEVEGIVAQHGHKAHGRDGAVVRDCSTTTRQERRMVILQCFAELQVLGFKLEHPRSLRRKHIEALAEHWRSKELAPMTLHKRMSALRVFCRWLGKRDVVGDLQEYFTEEETRRQIAAVVNRAWEANDVNIEAKIREAAQLDERLPLMMSMQWHFGLRMKEAIEMRPLRAETPDGLALMVTEGTKGGRPRLVPFPGAQARDAFQAAKAVAARTRSRRLRWPDCHTWRQAQRRYLHYMRQLGLTKAELGVTSHGLRHTYAQRVYHCRTGLPTPVEGGALDRIDPVLHREASMEASRNLGHGRLDVTGFYYGTYGHALRAAKVTWNGIEMGPPSQSV